MQRRMAVLLLAGSLLSGCSSGNPSSAAPPAPAQRITEAGWAPGGPPAIDFSTEHPAVTANLPTYRETGPTTAPPYPPPGALASPERQSQDVPATLNRLAEHLESTGKPDVPGDVPATLVAAMNGDAYVYNLGNVENQPGAAADRLHIYMLKRQGTGWAATRLCQEASHWVRVQRTEGGTPVVLCEASVGNGHPYTQAKAYVGDREIFAGEGLEPGIEFRPGRQDGPPDMQVHRLHWWMGRRMAPIVERITLTWQEGRYVIAKVERREDAHYHLARFATFLEAGEMDKAAAEMASPPPEGLGAYLRRQAPDWSPWPAGPKLLEPAGERWRYAADSSPTRGALLLSIAPDGRIAEIGQEPRK